MTTLLLAALAIWRVAVLIAVDRGPFDVMTTVRGRLAPDRDTWQGEGIRCPWCVSFWLALGVSLVIAPVDLTNVPGLDWLLWWLALAGAACLIDGIARR